MRDGEDDPDLAENTILSRTAGPPYHRLLPRAARHHLYRLLRAVQMDLIFVEDGVGFRRLRKVLRVLFEIYDVHGGRRRAEEVDFRGLPGTRVLIHDFQFDEPFKIGDVPGAEVRLPGPGADPARLQGPRRAGGAAGDAVRF